MFCTSVPLQDSAAVFVSKVLKLILRFTHCLLFTNSITRTWCTSCGPKVFLPNRRIRGVLVTKYSFLNKLKNVLLSWSLSLKWCSVLWFSALRYETFFCSVCLSSSFQEVTRFVGGESGWNRQVTESQKEQKCLPDPQQVMKYGCHILFLFLICGFKFERLPKLVNLFVTGFKYFLLHIYISS